MTAKLEGSCLAEVTPSIQSNAKQRAAEDPSAAELKQADQERFLQMKVWLVSVKLLFGQIIVQIFLLLLCSSEDEMVYFLFYLSIPLHVLAAL